jgi:hypothetical protein
MVQMLNMFLFISETFGDTYSNRLTKVTCGAYFIDEVEHEFESMMLHLSTITLVVIEQILCYENLL